MEEVIQQDGEPRGNRIRARIDAVVGRGQRTYTPTQTVIESADGWTLRTVDGHELIDFTSGVLVANLGYAHPLFEERFRHYCAKLPRNAYNMATEIEAIASERLLAAINLPGAHKVLWAASGSEGIQKAMWSAMHHAPERSILLATRGGFHGKKGLAGEVTGESTPNPNVRFVSFPMKENYGPDFFQSELNTLGNEFTDRIALFITEPYLGARGSYHPPKWYHKLVVDWCRKNKIPFIFDEVQSCFGRTGNMFAFETYEIEPDLVVLGKGLGNGEPASAVIGKADLIDSLHYGEASDTFSGNPRACAAVCATLDVFEQESILERCKAVAPRLNAELNSLKDQFSFIAAVRGEGFVYGIEMASDELANRCVLEAYKGNGKQGVHFLGPLAGNVLRVSPPLIMTEKSITHAISLIRQVWGRIT